MITALQTLHNSDERIKSLSYSPVFSIKNSIFKDFVVLVFLKNSFVEEVRVYWN